MGRKLPWAVLGATLALAGPAMASADGVEYTLDGKPASAEVATAADGGCSGTVAADGTIPCFSSSQKLAQTAADALEAGKLPPGYLALPTGTTREELLKRFRSRAAAGGPTRPVPSQGASAARRSRGNKKIRARAADSYYCNGQDYTYQWEHANYSGGYAWTGWTGQNTWGNFTGSINNNSSSFWNTTDKWVARWHDYYYGGGAYYGNGYKCRAVENLSNASMTDGGSANDRFSSFANW